MRDAALGSAAKRSNSASSSLPRVPTGIFLQFRKPTSLDSISANQCGPITRLCIRLVEERRLRPSQVAYSLVAARLELQEEGLHPGLVQADGELDAESLE